MVFMVRTFRLLRAGRGGVAWWLGTALALSLALLFTPAGWAGPDDGARAEFLRGYKFFEGAEKADGVKDYAAAADGYRQALQIYQGIAAQWPRWNEDLITYRIKYCLEKGVALDKLIQAQRRTQPSVEAVQINTQMETDLKLAKTALGDLQVELQRLKGELEKARGEAAGNAELTELNKKLAWENREKGQTIDALNAKLTELSRQLTAAKDDDALNKAHEELQQARVLLATTVQQAKDDHARLEAANADLGAQAKRLALAVAEAQLKVDTMGPNLQAAETRRAAAQAQVDEGQKKVAALTAQVADGAAAVAQLQKQVAELNGTLAKVQQDANHDTLADTLKAQKDAAQAREDLLRQVAATEKLKTGLASTLEDLGVVQQANAKLREQVQEKERELDRLQHSGATSNEELQVAKGQAEKLAREQQALQGKYDALVTMNRTLDGNVQELNGKYKAQLQVNEMLLTRLKDAETAAAQATAAAEAALQAIVAAPPAPAPPAPTPVAPTPPTAVATTPAPVTPVAPVTPPAPPTPPPAVATTPTPAPVAPVTPAVPVTPPAPSPAVATAPVTSPAPVTPPAPPTVVATTPAATTPATTAPAAMVTKTPAPAATTASVGAPLTPLIGPLPAPMAGSEAAEVTRLRQRLDEVQQRSRGEVALLNRQITTLIEQLDVERAKNAKNAAGQVAAPAPGTTTPPSERIQGMLRRAVAAEKQGQTQSATFQYQQVLELEPAQPLALVRLGNLALDQGQPKEAEKYLLRAFYVNPDDKDVLLPLGSIYVRAEKADLAIAMLARAVALYPDQAPMHRFLGVACSSLGWVEAGELQLKRAFALDPKDPEAAFDLAVLYATKEPPRLPLARQWYATAKELGAASDPGLEKLFGTAAP